MSKLGRGSGVAWLARCGARTCRGFTTVLGGPEEAGGAAEGLAVTGGDLAAAVTAARAREVPLWLCYKVEPMASRAGLDLGGGMGVEEDSRFLA